MTWYTKVKYDCRNTTYRIDKQQNGRLGLVDLVALYTHLYTCPFCRLYKKQTKILQQLIRKSLTTNDNIILDDVFKAGLQRTIEDRLK